MTKNQKEQILDMLINARRSFSDGEIEEEQQIIEDLINLVSSY